MSLLFMGTTIQCCVTPLCPRVLISNPWYSELHGFATYYVTLNEADRVTPGRLPALARAPRPPRLAVRLPRNHILGAAEAHAAYPARLITGVLQKGDRFKGTIPFSQIWQEEITTIWVLILHK